jgi:hypothetical protein
MSASQVGLSQHGTLRWGIAHTDRPADESLMTDDDDGAYRDRTGDLRLAKPTLSQLS